MAIYLYVFVFGVLVIGVYLLATAVYITAPDSLTSQRVRQLGNRILNCTCNECKVRVFFLLYNLTFTIIKSFLAFNFAIQLIL